jgi:hypothetical protein
MVAAMVLITGAVLAEELVLPVVTVGWPGKAGNLWRSEVFATNPGPQPVELTIGPFLPGKITASHPCVPPSPYRRELPAYGTLRLTPEDLSIALGCPDWGIGGLTFSADTPVSLVARVANVTGFPNEPSSIASRLLSGYGQQIPAIPASQLAVYGTVYQIPGLILDPNPCAPPRFETYLYVANPDSESADVTLQQDEQGLTSGELVLAGRPVATPYTFKVPAQGWVQLLVQPGGNPPESCTDPQVVDLFFTTTGPIALVGAVVDRGSQEPRTVLPLATIP